MEQFRKIVKEARNQFINEKINDRLKSALNASVEKLPEETIEQDLVNEDGIITTEEELDGYNIIKAVLRDKVDVNRIVMRDTKSYCGILLDDNNRKPICRLRFNNSKKYLGLFSNKREERIPIEDINDIFRYTDQITSTLSEYEVH
jgi:hypothetical protein